MVTGRRPALGLSEAAARLGVSPQRICQMVRSGALSGPRYKVPRAPRGAKRVWLSSVQAGLDRRNQSRSKATDAAQPTAPNDALVRADAQGAAARAATQHLKVQLDAARELLRAERAASKRLAQLVAGAAQALAAQGERADRLDDIASGYSDALTQLLTPDSPENLNEPG